MDSIKNHVLHRNTEKIKEYGCKQFTKLISTQQVLSLKMYLEAGLIGYTQRCMVLTWIGNMLVLQEAIVVCNKIQKWASQGNTQGNKLFTMLSVIPQSNFSNATSKERPGNLIWVALAQYVGVWVILWSTYSHVKLGEFTYPLLRFNYWLSALTLSLTPTQLLKLFLCLLWNSVLVLRKISWNPHIFSEYSIHVFGLQNTALSFRRKFSRTLSSGNYGLFLSCSTIPGVG